MKPRHLVRALAEAVALLAAVVVFNFFLFRVIDRDPLARYRGRSKLTAEQKAAQIKRFGLDGSKWDQFVGFVKSTVRLDFGRSFDSRRPVLSEIGSKLAPTLLLVGISTALAISLGLWLGSKAGWRRESRFDTISTGSSMLLYAVPEFFLGTVLLVAFAFKTGWFPTGGIRDVTANYSGFRALTDRAHHLVLPVLTLALSYYGGYSLIMRTSMVETLREDYLVTARAKGLRDREVWRRHAVPNALLPSISQSAIGFGFVLGGAITTETVFSYPGLGLATYDAIANNDLPMLQGLFFFSSLAVVGFNVLSDVVLAWLDPRVRL